MPIYEYTCKECGKRSSKFFKVIPEKEPEGQTCAHCGSIEISKDLPKISYIRSQATRHEASGDPDAPGADYWRDPSNIGRWAEKRLDRSNLWSENNLWDTGTHDDYNNFNCAPNVDFFISQPERICISTPIELGYQIDQILDKRGLD